VSIVRLFPARVVRPEWARKTVTALSDSVDESGIDLYRVAVDPDAYADTPVSLYVYRQTVGGASYSGVVCEVSVQAVADGRVRGHEAVHPQRVEALVWHHATMDGPPALVELLHRAGPEYTRTLEEVQRTEPLLDFIGPHGIQQTVWRLPEGDATSALAEELGATDFYIADGHHRATAALEEWETAGKPADAGLLCVVHPMDGLRLDSFHRRVPGPVDPDALIRLVSEGFDVRETGRPTLPVSGAVGMYVGHRWFELTDDEERPAGVAGLDVAVLQARVLDRLDPAPGGRTREVETIPATASVDQLALRCDVDSGALFTLAPPSTDALVEVADAGEVMPPKTTYFDPKPATGIFLRR
jgi:uncharacterized protein (DUF1015 family)